MTHPLRVAENCTTHPLHKAQNLMTHSLSAPAHPPLYFLTSPLSRGITFASTALTLLNILLDHASLLCALRNQNVVNVITPYYTFHHLTLIRFMERWFAHMLSQLFPKRCNSSELLRNHTTLGMRKVCITINALADFCPNR